MKRLVVIYCLMLMAIIFTACAPPPALVKLQPPDYAPKFNVVSGKLSKDLGIKGALLAPQGEIKILTVPQPQMGMGLFSMIQPATSKTQMKSESQRFPSQMNSNLLKSIEAIALQKGYNVVSAYDSIEVMAYEDKKKIDLLIIPEIQLQEEGNIVPAVETPKSMSMVTIQKGKINYTGQYKVTGQLIFQIIEPLTREKLFIKSVPYSTNPVDIDVIVEFDKPDQIAPASSIAYQAQQTAITNARNQALENAYEKLIELVKTYLPGEEEAVNLAKQAKELKTIKRY